MKEPQDAPDAIVHPIVHSPGPWMRDGIASDSMRSAIIRDANGFEVANSRSWLADQYEANARLIAAAPDLLEALKAARSWICRCGDWGGEDPPFEQMRAAIEKATN